MYFVLVCCSCRVLKAHSNKQDSRTYNERCYSVCVVVGSRLYILYLLCHRAKLAPPELFMALPFTVLRTKRGACVRFAASVWLTTNRKQTKDSVCFFFTHKEEQTNMTLPRVHQSAASVENANNKPDRHQSKHIHSLGRRFRGIPVLATHVRRSPVAIPRTPVGLLYIFTK